MPTLTSPPRSSSHHRVRHHLHCNLRCNTTVLLLSATLREPVRTPPSLLLLLLL
eukprot:COSAG06_NODE_32947_length_497_cov_2.597990_2_plen_53_part_01